MNICDKINSIDFSNKLIEARILLETAEAKLDYLGNEILTAPLYEGSIGLREVAQKVHFVAAQYRRLNIEQRQEGLKIVNRLTKLYEDIDFQISRSDRITYSLNAIGNFFKSIPTVSTPDNIRNGNTRAMLTAMTPTQYRMAFGKPLSNVLIQIRVGKGVAEDSYPIKDEEILNYSDKKLVLHSV